MISTVWSHLRLTRVISLIPATLLRPMQIRSSGGYLLIGWYYVSLTVEIGFRSGNVTTIKNGSLSGYYVQ
jgi:hypothetical protein